VGSRKGSYELSVRVTPRASANRIESQPDGSVKAWVTAAPADGAANEAVLALLAKELGIPKSALSIVKGHAARNKRIRIAPKGR